MALWWHEMAARTPSKDAKRQGSRVENALFTWDNCSSVLDSTRLWHFLCQVRARAPENFFRSAGRKPAGFTRPSGRVRIETTAACPAPRRRGGDSPGPRAGCGLKQDRHVRPPDRQEDSPGPRAGCGLKHQHLLGRSVAGRRFTRPSGRVRIETASRHNGSRFPRWDSPGPRAGCGLKLDQRHGVAFAADGFTRPSGRVRIETVRRRGGGEVGVDGFTRPSGRVRIETRLVTDVRRGNQRFTRPSGRVRIETGSRRAGARRHVGFTRPSGRVRIETTRGWPKSSSSRGFTRPSGRVRIETRTVWRCRNGKLRIHPALGPGAD